MQPDSSQSQFQGTSSRHRYSEDLLRERYTVMSSDGQRVVMPTIFEEEQVDLPLAKTAVPDIEMAVMWPGGVWLIFDLYADSALDSFGRISLF